MSAGVTPTEPERLNKLLAHAGVGSRRHCDDLIRAGRVTVGGRVVTELGTRVDPDTADVFVDAERVKVEKPAYWLVHKPRGYLCTNHDPAGRPRAIDLVEHVEQRVYTVGRLDEASEGLLLLTNDGDLAFRLMHPRFGVEKTYLVQVAGSPTEADLRQLLDGVWIAEGRARARHVKRLKRQGDSTWLKIVLCEGKNREIRRMLAKLGHKVLRLKRTAIGPVEIDRLPVGKARKLKPDEVKALVASTERRRREEEEGDEANRKRPPRRNGTRQQDNRPPRREQRATGDPSGGPRRPSPESAHAPRSPRPERDGGHPPRGDARPPRREHPASGKTRHPDSAHGHHSPRADRNHARPPRRDGNRSPETRGGYTPRSQGRPPKGRR